MASITSYFTTLLVIFNIVLTSNLSSTSRNHAYFSRDEDSHYIGEGIPVTFHKEFSSTSGKLSVDESIFNSRVHLKFLPPVLDFKERHLGIAYHERVTIINLSCNRTLVMSSISGSTLHFHSSFFQDKMIPPMGNTSFSVVFLGREEREVRSYLYIHTSEGSFKYQVRGEGVRSPYRLRSLSPVSLPLNATYTPEIFIHNPHPTPIQILEVYSSGSEFRLELPGPAGSLRGGPRQIWQIPPFSTKPIVRLSFHTLASRNHSAYIRLKVERWRGEVGEVLLIPIDVEVHPHYGLYAPDDLIDFGYGPSQRPPQLKRVKLLLKNSSKKPIKIMNISTSPSTKAIRINYKEISVPPLSDQPTEVALLTLDWEEAFKSGLVSGEIIVSGDTGTEKVAVKYRVSVLEGSLQYDSSQVMFKSDETEISPRLVNITNNFKLPVFVTRVSLGRSASPYFEVKELPSVLIQPDETKSVFYLEAKTIFLGSYIMLESEIQVFTNASTLSIPLFCFTGKLKVSGASANETTSHLGSLMAGRENPFSFLLINENPIPVRIEDIEVNVSEALIGLVFLSRENSSNPRNREVWLAGQSRCVLRVRIPPAAEPFSTPTRLSIRTPFETIFVDFAFRVAPNDHLRALPPSEGLDYSYKGEVCPRAPVYMFHSGADLRQILASSTSSSQLFSSSEKFFWFDLWPSDPSSHLALFYNLTGAESLLAGGEPLYRGGEHLGVCTLVVGFHNCLRLDSELDPELLSLRPEFLSPNSAELLWLSPTELLRLNPELLGLDSELLSSNSGELVRLEETRSSPPAKPPPASSSPVSDSSDLSISHVEKTSVKLVLEPADQSISAALSSGNLSSPDRAENVSGRRSPPASKSRLRVSPNYPVLLFEVTDELLKNCEAAEGVDTENNELVGGVRRTFLARNSGESALEIRGFKVSGQPCQGFGFRVIDCQPLRLEPNTSQLIEMAFSPDFTLSKMSRHLSILLDNSTSVGYSLVGTVPAYLLAACSGQLRRPSWEPILYYSAVSFVLFLLICVLSAALFESNRILRNTIISLSRENNLQPVLDLRSVGSEDPLLLRTKELANRGKGIEVSTDWPQNQPPPSSFPCTHHQVGGTCKDNLKQISEGGFSVGYTNKCPILGPDLASGLKKRSERTACKRFAADGADDCIDKTYCESTYSRPSRSEQPLKTSICITTEPYIPLTNIKTRDSSLTKSEFSCSKYDQSRFIEFQKRRTKKKGINLANDDFSKKKSLDVNQLQNIFGESDSSQTTSESSCSDEGEKEVESRFLESVRQQLDNKTSRGRAERPEVKRKASLEKTQSSGLDLDWDPKRKVTSEKSLGNHLTTAADWELVPELEDEASERGSSGPGQSKVSRRSTSTGGLKQGKKPHPCGSSAKARPMADPSQPRPKQTFAERSAKTSLRKDKAQSSKKRNERMEKRVSSSKGGSLVPAGGGEGGGPPVPQVWTASFSDVVAGTEVSYSSVVATSSAQSRKHQQLNLSTQDSGSSCSGSSVTNFSPCWKSEYQDALEQQETTPQAHSVGVEMKEEPGLSQIWTEWALSLAESPLSGPQAFAPRLSSSPTLPPLPRTSIPSLFTDAPPAQVATHERSKLDRARASRAIWRDGEKRAHTRSRRAANQLKNMTYDPLWTDHNLMASMQEPTESSFHGGNGVEKSWPVWEPLYTPAAVDSPPPVWGSEVWGPPQPLSPPPPPLHSATPPNLSQLPPNNTMRLDYDPFRSLSNIWAQHSPNIWKSPPTPE